MCGAVSRRHLMDSTVGNSRCLLRIAVSMISWFSIMNLAIGY